MFKLNDQSIQQKADEYFRIYDKNNNGVLEEDETVLFLNQFFQSVGRNINAETLNQVKNIVDSNGDGKISKEELIQILKKSETDYQNKGNAISPSTNLNNGQNYGQGSYNQGNYTYIKPNPNNLNGGTTVIRDPYYNSSNSNTYTNYQTRPGYNNGTYTSNTTYPSTYQPGSYQGSTQISYPSQPQNQQYVSYTGGLDQNKHGQQVIYGQPAQQVIYGQHAQLGQLGLQTQYVQQSHPTQQTQPGQVIYGQTQQGLQGQIAQPDFQSNQGTKVQGDNYSYRGY